MSKYGVVKVEKVKCVYCKRLFLDRVIAKQHPDFCAPLGWKSAA